MYSTSKPNSINAAAQDRGVLMCAAWLGRNNTFGTNPSPSIEGLEHQDDMSRGSP
jgi:hypothetical protein